MVILSEINQAESARQFPLTMFLSVLALVGFIGNSIVCYIYANVYKNSNSRCFIRWLAAIDLSTCLIAIPIEIAIVLNQYEFRMTTACKISRFMNSMGTVSSSTILILIATDRFRKICKPIYWQISSKTAKILSASSFIFGVVASIPNISLYGIRTRTVSEGGAVFNGTECSVSDEWKGTLFPIIYNGISFALFVVASIMLVCFYSIIGRRVRFFAQKREERRCHSSSLAAIFDENTDTNKLTIQRRLQELNRNHSTAEAKCIENDDYAGDTEKWTNMKKDSNAAMYKSTETVLSVLSEKTDERNLAKVENENNVESHNENKHLQNKPDIVIQLTPEGLATKVPLIVNNGNVIDQPEPEIRQRNEGSYQISVSPMPSSCGTSTPNNFKAKQQMDYMRNKNKCPEKTTENRRLAKSTTYLMFLISMVFILTFLPYLTLAVVRELKPGFVDGLSNAGRTAYRFFLRSYFMNCAVNPIIYSIFDRRFRSACRQTFNDICRKLCGNK